MRKKKKEMCRIDSRLLTIEKERSRSSYSDAPIQKSITEEGEAVRVYQGLQQIPDCSQRQQHRP